MKQLSELNSHVSVNVAIYALTYEIISNYNIVVLTNFADDKITQILNLSQ